MSELVGILNITPDSFSDGGQYSAPDSAISHATQLYAGGASIVDVGAESTRPGATALDWQEEVSRLSKFIERAKHKDWQISLDTYHPETVVWASKHLAHFIINDVTGFRDPDMRTVAAKIGAKVIVSHLPESSADIQSAHNENPVDSVEQVVEELGTSVEKLVLAGVAKQNVIVDPGIGFGKTIELNWRLLEFGRDMPEHRVMVGYSRKRFLGADRMELEPNLHAGRIAVNAGVAYLRVHDVRGHAQLVQ